MGGTAHAAGAGDNEDMPAGALVAVGRACGDEGSGRSRGDKKAGGRHPVDQGPGKADVGEQEAAVLSSRGIEELSNLGEAEGDCRGGGDRNVGNAAEVCRKAGRDIDGEHRFVEAVDEHYCRRGKAADGRVEAGPENGIDDE